MNTVAGVQRNRHERAFAVDAASASSHACRRRSITLRRERPFDTPVPPSLLHVHGAVMSGWEVLLMPKTILVAARRVRRHRRLG